MQHPVSRAACGASGNRSRDRHLLVLLGLVALYTAIFATLWIVRQRALFSYEWEDDAARNQMIYNTLRGRPFFSSVKGVYFGGHVSIVWALLAVPALIYPGIETACIILTLGLALAAVPVYLVGREALSSRGEALVLGAAFLLYAPLHAVNLHTLNAVTPAVPLLAWAYWAFYRRRLKAFLAFAFLAMLSKEDIALAVVIFGVYGLWQRRGCKWGAVPIAAGVIWLAIAFKLILPQTYPRDYTPTSWLIGARQSEEAGGPGGVAGALSWMAANPGSAAQRALTADRWLLFGQLFGPVLLVCFLSPGPLLMAVPALGLLLLHDGPLSLFHRHWIAPPIPFLMIATVLGCAAAKRFFAGAGARAVRTSLSLSGRGQGEGRGHCPSPSPLPGGERGKPGALAYHAVIAGVLVGCAASNFAPNIIGQMRVVSWGRPEPPQEMQRASLIYDPVFYRPTERSRDAWALIRQIPRQASVAASGDLLVPLSARPVLYVFLDRNAPWRDVEYLLINTRAVYFGAGRYPLALTRGDAAYAPEMLPEVHRERVRSHIEAMLAGGEWMLVDRQGEIYLLRRTAFAAKPSAYSPQPAEPDG